MTNIRRSRLLACGVVAAAAMVLALSLALSHGAAARHTTLSADRSVKTSPPVTLLVGRAKAGELRIKRVIRALVANACLTGMPENDMTACFAGTVARAGGLFRGPDAAPTDRVGALVGVVWPGAKPSYGLELQATAKDREFVQLSTCTRYYGPQMLHLPGTGYCYWLGLVTPRLGMVGLR